MVLYTYNHVALIKPSALLSVRIHSDSRDVAASYSSRLSLCFYVVDALQDYVVRVQI